MTKRKENAKLGRPAVITPLALRMLRRRWKHFEKQPFLKGLSASQKADVFIRKNREWLRSHRINPGQYTSLKNRLSEGLQEHKREFKRRRGTISSWLPEKSQAHLLYLQAAKAHALGLSPFPGFLPLGLLSEFQ
jgi:hypothetical protein